MTIQIRMMNKNGIVTTKIARELMTMSEGSRIDTVSGYAKKFDSARGTVQEVIKLLENEECVKFLKRGHLGTFITFIDYEKLWQFTNWGVLTGAAPLPYTKKHEGIATAIYYQMEHRHIPFSFAYMQGAGNRVRGLLDHRYDFAILNKRSAIEFISNHKELEIVIEFKPKSYLSGYAILFSKADNEEIVEGMKVGIDNNSPDHVVLTEKLCYSKNVEYVNISYSQMIPSLLKGDIDAAVYNEDVIAKPELKGVISYKNINLKDYDGNEQTKAVILINNEAFGVGNLLKQIINVENVDKIQREVIAGNIIPTY